MTRNLNLEGEAIDTVETEISYYQGNLDLPMIWTNFDFSWPNKEQIIKICEFGPPSDVIVKKKPLRIKENATFVVKRTLINLKHPFDLDADDIAGAFSK